MTAIELLQRRPAQGAGVRPAPSASDDEDRGRVLACAYCRRPVTTTAARISVNGSHEHTFVNPHGIAFHIGCFATASGCRLAGEASDYWTWFPGYAWRIEQCGRCGEHLGWLFRGADDGFHGLIVDRLAEIEET